MNEMKREVETERNEPGNQRRDAMRMLWVGERKGWYLWWFCFVSNSTSDYLRILPSINSVLVNSMQ